jgi:hypothetical protein
MDATKRGVWRWKEAQRKGEFTNHFSTYIYTPQNMYTCPCQCIWQIFALVLCKCKKYLYTQLHDKCKCKKFGHVNVNDLPDIYTPYIQLLTLIHTTLVTTTGY